jgi:hypothetical protein
VEKEIIKYIEVPVAVVEEVEVYSIMPVEIEVEKLVKVPVVQIHEIPVELILQNDVAEKLKEEVDLEI